MKLKNFLLTALLLFAGVSGVYAERHYVGFASGNTDGDDLSTALGAANPYDTVFVAAGLYLADATEFTVKQNVTLIGGYAKGDIGATTRRYPGQFVPFDSSNLSTTTKFTILDGNSYKRSLASQKHRVVTVNAGGVVDGCLIRNGHVRNDHGGGVLLDGGNLYNSIVRGNVAMSKPDTIESLGGGVFIKNGGELINCLVAYNMANDGYGVAAGTGGGKMINNTITANTYSPVFAKIPATTGFHLYEASTAFYYRPSGDVITEWGTAISLREFYISRIETTEGQYAVFCAAMDIPKAISGTDTVGKLNLDVLKTLQEPVLNAGTVEERYKFNGTPSSGVQDFLKYNKNENDPGLRYADGVWYPHLDTASVEYPMGYVSWHGSLAYAVWLGGGLPTLAQWQLAARCNPDGTVSNNLYSGAYGSSNDVSSGKNESTDTATWRILDTIAWVDASKSIDTFDNKINASDHWTSRPHEVARKRPNAMGIYDMAGNVEEWTGDRYAGGFPPYKTPFTDPISNSEATWTTRLYLGSHYRGTFRNDYSLPYYSSYSSPGSIIATVGFRPIVAF